MSPDDFNAEVLRLWYITRQTVRPTPNQMGIDTGHHKLLSRRYFLGSLCQRLSTPASSLFASILEAVSYLSQRVAEDELPLDPISAVLGDRWRNFVCTAMSDFCQNIVVEADHPGFAVSEEFIDHGPAAWALLSVLKFGKLELIQQAYHHLVSESIQSNHKLDEVFLQSCLHLAIKENWTEAFHYLVALHLDPRARSKQQHPLHTATSNGRAAFLKCLLDSSVDGHSVMSTSPAFEKATMLASSHEDQTSRRQMVNLLLLHCSNSPSKAIRKEIFCGACRTNDVELAALALEHGVVDLYWFSNFVSTNRNQRCPLTIAADSDSVDCLKFILKTSPPDTDTTKVAHNFEYAFKSACTNKSVEMIRVLLPYQSYLSFSEVYMLCAEVDGGVAAMEEQYGEDCLATRGQRPAADTVWRGNVTTVGGEALRQSVLHLNAKNVELLLSRGAVPTDALKVCSTKTEEDKIALATIKNLLEAQGHHIIGQVADPSLYKTLLRQGHTSFGDL